MARDSKGLTFVFLDHGQRTRLQRWRYDTLVVLGHAAAGNDGLHSSGVHSATVRNVYDSSRPTEVLGVFGCTGVTHEVL